MRWIPGIVTGMPKIGELLQAKGIITSRQLEQALKEQQENGGRLGSILISLGYISARDIDETIPVPSQSRLGERLVENRDITADQLKSALDYQKNNGGLLGETLVKLGYTTQDVIEQNLAVMNRRIPIGELLVQNGEITPQQLQKALDFQKRSDGPLGDILLSLKMVSTDTLYRYLANQNCIGRPGSKFNFDGEWKMPFEQAKKYNAVILNCVRESCLLGVIKALDDATIAEIERSAKHRVEQVLISRSELDYYWAYAYTRELSWESRDKLSEEEPQNSAVKTFTRIQRILIIVLVLGIALGLSWNALQSALILNIIAQVYYFLMIAFKMFIMMKGFSKDAQLYIKPEELAALDERELPVYTVLVPMYKEKYIAERLLKNIENIDYPKSKLDVRLLLEEDDLDTINLARSLDLPAYYTIMVVPHSLPKTKPKACNYGLINARGKYTVIYDAEDKPEPDQLKKVYLAFKSLPKEYVCIQAKLNYYNSKQNIITTWFTQEYSMWFELLLPGVMQLDIPLPLGGTSNHFKTEELKKIGAWDPFNVTEDADLGIRLFKEGYKTAIISSRTWEEATSRLSVWINQRSRWLKGYMQTWLVHMRNPYVLFRELGLKGFWGFQVTVFGTFFLPLVNPVFWALLFLWFTTHAAWIEMLFPSYIYYASLFLLIGGNFFFVYSNVVGVYWVLSDKSRRSSYDHGKPLPFSYENIKFALLTPVYWFLMSVASFKALWQLIFKPTHWEKTEHGLHGDKYDLMGDMVDEPKKGSS
jgi:cellulose synthase/poly-beta-1,6-N-acetylglucosamine synthase-like glycosyltransferase